jgi:hypothetical protein
MKYSIFGFDQEQVLKFKTTIDVNGKEKEVYIDVTDLLILQCIADLMNRQCVFKYIINDKMYFSIQYKALLEDLPILMIGKQAMRDRIDKLVLFNLLEKEVIRNEQGSFAVFRIGTSYEQLVYNKKGVTVCSEIEGGVYQTTYGCVSNYTPKNSSTINTSTKEKEIDKSISKKVKKDELFEQCWKEYRRKGSKAQAKVQWAKLKTEDRNTMLQHIQAYVSTRELQYQKDFERYLKLRLFDTIVISNDKVVYDPSKSENLFTNNDNEKTTTKNDILVINGVCYK